MNSPALSRVSDGSKSDRTCRWSVATHNDIIYSCQVCVIYLIVVVCLVNLSLYNDKDCIWSTLLSASIGYLLPPPKLKRIKNDPLLPNAPQQ